MSKSLMTEFQFKEQLRSHFMELVMEKVPDVLEELRNNVFQAYKQTLLAEIKPVGMPNFPLRPGNDEETKAIKPVIDWSKKWSLDADWIRVKALINMALWLHHGMTGMEWESPKVITFEGQPPTLSRFQFEYKFDVRVESYADVLKKAEQKFKQRFKEYWDQEKGRLPYWYRNSRNIQEKHLVWLVMYTAGGKTRKEITEMEGNAVVQHAISQEIHDIAELIDLPIPDRRGRPRKGQ